MSLYVEPDPEKIDAETILEQKRQWGLTRKARILGAGAVIYLVFCMVLTLSWGAVAVPLLGLPAMSLLQAASVGLGCYSIAVMVGVIKVVTKEFGQ